MLEWLDKVDKDLLIMLNNQHSPFWDKWMLNVTDRFFWIPFYALIVIFLLVEYKRKFWLVLLFIAALVLAADQVTSGFMKPFFERLRPCHNEEILSRLILIKDCGGQYGFASSHAANTFSLAIFMIFLFKEKHKWIYLLLAWASLVSYSRIYLGVHYPGDIFAGIMVGSFLALLFYRLYTWSEKKVFFANSN